MLLSNGLMVALLAAPLWRRCRNLPAAVIAATLLQGPPLLVAPSSTHAGQLPRLWRCQKRARLRIPRMLSQRRLPSRPQCSAATSRQLAAPASGSQEATFRHLTHAGPLPELPRQLHDQDSCRRDHCRYLIRGRQPAASQKATWEHRVSMKPGSWFSYCLIVGCRDSWQ